MLRGQRNSFKFVRIISLQPPTASSIKPNHSGIIWWIRACHILHFLDTFYGCVQNVARLAQWASLLSRGAIMKKLLLTTTLTLSSLMVSVSAQADDLFIGQVITTAANFVREIRRNLMGNYYQSMTIRLYSHS